VLGVLLFAPLLQGLEHLSDFLSLRRNSDQSALARDHLVIFRAELLFHGIGLGDGLAGVLGGDARLPFPGLHILQLPLMALSSSSASAFVLSASALMVWHDFSGTCPRAGEHLVGLRFFLLDGEPLLPFSIECLRTAGIARWPHQAGQNFKARSSSMSSDPTGTLGAPPTDRENDLALAIRDGPKFMARLQQLADATAGSLLQAPLCSGAAADSSRLWAPANREF
jgi:hypothetical protein